MSRLCIMLAICFAVACAATSCRKKSQPAPTSPLKKIETRPVLLTALPAAPTSTQESQPSSAALHARQLLSDSSSSLMIQRLLSSVYQTATQAAADSRTPYTDLLQAGDRALAKGDYTSAQAAFRKACDLDPQRLEAFEGLAMTLSASDQFEAAAEVYSKIVDLLAQRERASASAPAATSSAGDFQTLRQSARHNQAVSLARAGRLGDAQDIYRRLIADEPSNIRYRFNLSVVLQARGQLQEAAKSWRELLADTKQLSQPEAAFAWSCLGQLSMELDKPDEAMDAFAQAAKLAPNDANAWLNYSVSAKASGSLGKAVVAARRAVAIADKNDSLHSHLGGLYLELYRQKNDASHLRSALDAWGRSLDLNPNQPELAKLVEHYRTVLNAASFPATASSPHSSAGQ